MRSKSEKDLLGVNYPGGTTRAVPFLPRSAARARSMTMDPAREVERGGTNEGERIFRPLDEVGGRLTPAWPRVQAWVSCDGF